MVRPRKAPAENRTTRLPWARVTVAERLHVEAQAVAAGLSAAEFVRRCVLGRRVAPSRSRIEDAALVQLIRVGNNLNQLARAANSGLAPDRPALQAALAELRGILERLVQADADAAADVGGPADGP